MTSVEATPQLARGGLFALGLAAVRFRNPWTKTYTETKERVINLEEVTWHDNANDCWIIIYDRVYDITKFLQQHPGGMDVLLENAGRDVTLAFRGTGHSSAAVDALQKYYIGRLPWSECIYRKPGGIILSNLPE
ncbi:cytochrome b5-like [Arctopsyche grandis]|uniref:cytochrome b5-like n=1 Tax=Arctopsyche grandis TaxID=121162 RepID=UPI00406D91FC